MTPSKRLWWLHWIINSLAWLVIGLFLCQTAFGNEIKIYPKEPLLTLIDNYLKSQPFLQPYLNQTTITLAKTLNPLPNLVCVHEPKLTLPQAHSGLHARMRVYAECTEPTPWKVNIPLQVTIHHPIVVTQKPMQQGETFSDDHLVLQPVDILSLHEGFFDNQQPIIGKVAKQNMPAGQVISPRHVQAPKLIKRGEMVLISVKKQGLQVKMKGRSLEDGFLGSTVKVENLQSKRIVEGIVNQNKEVEVFI